MKQLQLQIKLQGLSLSGLLIAIIIPALLTSTDMYEAILSILGLSDSPMYRIASFGFEFGLLMLVIFSENNKENKFRYYVDMVLTLTITILIAVVNSMYLYKKGSHLAYGLGVSILIGAGFPFAIFALSEKFSKVLRNLVGNVKKLAENAKIENQALIDLQEDCENKAKEIISLTSELADKIVAYNAAKQEAEHNSNTLAAIVANKETYASSVAKMQEDVAKLGSEIGKLSSERKNLSTDIEKLSTEKKGLSTENEKLSTDKNELSTEIVRLSNEKSTLSTEIGKLRTEKNELDTEIGKLRTDKNSNQDAAKLRQEIQNLKAENDRLKNVSIQFDLADWKPLFNISKNIYTYEKDNKDSSKYKNELKDFLPKICKLKYP